MRSPDFVPPALDLDLLERIARSVARSRGLSPSDVDDFSQSVHARMAERGYDVFQKFEGRASLRTYLTVVVARLLKDWQNHEYGKWRPSAAAHRLGPLGAALDRELNRDGCSVEEADHLVASRTGVPEKDVRLLAQTLPRRVRRRRVTLEEAQHRGVAFADPVAATEQAQTASTARQALLRALAAVPRRDARLFVRRYLDRTSVATLAHEAGIDAKGLYRSFDRIRRALRLQIEAQGLGHAPALD